jgi:hypothetical protein
MCRIAVVSRPTLRSRLLLLLPAAKARRNSQRAHGVQLLMRPAQQLPHCFSRPAAWLLLSLCALTATWRTAAAARRAAPTARLARSSNHDLWALCIRRLRHQEFLP